MISMPWKREVSQHNIKLSDNIISQTVEGVDRDTALSGNCWKLASPGYLLGAALNWTEKKPISVCVEACRFPCLVAWKDGFGNNRNKGLRKWRSLSGFVYSKMWKLRDCFDSIWILVYFISFLTPLTPVLLRVEPRAWCISLSSPNPNGWFSLRLFLSNNHL